MMQQSDEYLVYGYTKYNIYNFGGNQWQFLSKNREAHRSQKEAEKLYQSQNFERIEIKRKYFDSRQNKFKLKTISVMGTQQKISLYAIATGLSVASAVLGFLYLW